MFSLTGKTAKISGYVPEARLANRQITAVFPGVPGFQREGEILAKSKIFRSPS
jgi:hypothetical protein